MISAGSAGVSARVSAGKKPYFTRLVQAVQGFYACVRVRAKKTPYFFTHNCLARVYTHARM